MDFEDFAIAVEEGPPPEPPPSQQKPPTGAPLPLQRSSAGVPPSQLFHPDSFDRRIPSQVAVAAPIPVTLGPPPGLVPSQQAPPTGVPLPQQGPPPGLVLSQQDPPTRVHFPPQAPPTSVYSPRQAPPTGAPPPQQRPPARLSLSQNGPFLPKSPDDNIASQIAVAANYAVASLFPETTYPGYAKEEAEKSVTPDRDVKCAPTVYTLDAYALDSRDVEPKILVSYPDRRREPPRSVARWLAQPATKRSAHEPAPYFTPDSFDLGCIVHIRNAQGWANVSDLSPNPPLRACEKLDVEFPTRKAETAPTTLSAAARGQFRGSSILLLNEFGEPRWARIPVSQNFPDGIYCDWCKVGTDSTTRERLVTPEALCPYHLYFAATREELRFTEDLALQAVIGHRGKALSVNSMVQFVRVLRECFPKDHELPPAPKRPSTIAPDLLAVQMGKNPGGQVWIPRPPTSYDMGLGIWWGPWRRRDIRTGAILR